MPKGGLYNWAGRAKRRKQNPETLSIGSFLIPYLRVFKLSLVDAQKTAPALIRG
jgi:hypothetical protein